MKRDPHSAKCILGILLITTLAAALGVHAQPTEVTVMTYNIRVGLGLDGSWSGHDPAENLAEIIEVIREAAPDIVLLQEVDRGVERTQGVDEPAVLAEALGMNHVFAPALEHQGGDYGIALLTTWEIESDEAHLLFRPDYGESHPELPFYFSEQRVALVAHLVSGEAEITAVNTHLGLTKEQRIAQLTQIGEIVEVLAEQGPVVFGGDLNCEPDASELEPVRDRLRDCYQGFASDTGLIGDMSISERLTFYSAEPTKCIDYLFVTESDVEVSETRVLETTASDHRPVVTRLTLTAR